MPAIIDDTYAEAFRSIYVEFLITARDPEWVEHAASAATGNASSTILCDCEAGVDRFVGPGGDESFATPDGRPGAIVQLHVPRFRKDRVEALEHAALVRISQNVLTCPTAACFNLIDSEEYFTIGRKIAYFGDGFQKPIERFGRKMWWIPTLGGEFVLDRRFGYADGLMGGNLWFFGESENAALAAAEAGVAAIRKCPASSCRFRAASPAADRRPAANTSSWSPARTKSTARRWSITRMRTRNCRPASAR